MYPDHLQNYLDYGHGLSIFLILVHLDLVKHVKFVFFRQGLQNALNKWPEILHVCMITIFRTDPILVTVCWFS